MNEYIVIIFAPNTREIHPEIARNGPNGIGVSLSVRLRLIDIRP